jgi:glycolate oxidase FAD binding subunit
MSAFELFINELQQRISQAGILTDVNILQNYTVDDVAPHAVITPTTVEEAALTVALANKHHLSLLPRGGGVQMCLGGIPEQFDILLLTNKLDRLLEHEAPDLTCHVEAGITLAALQTQLATKGQRLALDPAAAEEVTIGGLLATNMSGPKRFRYGTARDLVIGLSVIQADGEITRSGGRVVKNVAGYDLNKLYIGSLGTLGIIVEANVKLHPLPPSESTLLLTFVTLQDLMQTVIAVTGSLLQPTALELIDAKAASTLAKMFGLNLPTNGYTLAVNFEGRPSSIERQIDETSLLARQNNALMYDHLDGYEQIHFWNSIREQTQGTLTCKVSLMVSQVATYLDHVAQICRRYDLEAAVIGHVGNGILYIELYPSDAVERLVAAIDELRTHAQAAHGHLVVERCPVDLKQRVSIWGEPGKNFYMMQRLKQQFDPQNTFVRGRFLGGI